MILKFLIFILLINYLNAEYVNYSNYKVYKVVPSNTKEVNLLNELNNNGSYQFWNGYDVVKENKEIKVMVEPEKQKNFENYLANENVEMKIVVEDVQPLVEATLRRPNINRLSSSYAWDYYQSLEEIYEWLENTANDYPDVATVVNIGTTLGGREIRGMRIDFRRQQNATHGFMEGGLHAREWITCATLTWIIKEFLTSTDPEIRFLAENVVWHIFPVLNPDGYVYSFTDNRMWRKNRNPAHFQPCVGASDDMSNGVDLNRNFPFYWNTIGTSMNPCGQTFAGASPGSELETIAIINYINSIQAEGHLVYYLGFHSYTQLILIPYSHIVQADVLQVHNYGDLYEIAMRATDKLTARYGTPYYTVGTSNQILYPVSGSTFDWAHGGAGIPISFLYELRDLGEYGFLLPPEQIIPNNEEVMDSLIELDKVTRQIGYYSSSGFGFKFNAVLLVFAVAIAVLK